MIPNILSIAGSDPSGGAGIQADIKAISANGGYAMSVITALTAQNTQGVRAVHLPPVDFIVEQANAVFDDISTDAVKIGMLANADITRAITTILIERAAAIPVVVDPVMIAKGGASLLDPSGVDSLITQLIPQATLLTPNLPEAAFLLGCAPAQTETEMEIQATALRTMGANSVLLKGGHLDGQFSHDCLATADGIDWLQAPRILTRNTHGTGCTLAATIATNLGHGQSPALACTNAKRYIHATIEQAHQLKVGSGHGPVHHFTESHSCH